MSTLASLLMATSLIMGVHEGSHQAEADNQGVQVKWDKEQGEVMPLWKVMNKGNKDKLARIANAGLIGQQEFVSRLPEGDLKTAALIMSSLGKVSYSLRPGGINGTGDVNSLQSAKGDNIAPIALGLSGLADLYRAKNPDTKWSLDYTQTQDGTPVLEYTTQW